MKSLFPDATREFRDRTTQAPLNTPDLSLSFCQKACGFANNQTRAALCAFCYYSLPAEERLQYNYMAKHRLIIGEPIGFVCHSCDNRLSSIRISDECPECPERLLDYWLRPANHPVTQDGNIVIPIVYSDEESTDSEPEQ